MADKDAELIFDHYGQLKLWFAPRYIRFGR